MPSDSLPLPVISTGSHSPALSAEGNASSQLCDPWGAPAQRPKQKPSPEWERLSVRSLPNGKTGQCTLCPPEPRPKRRSIVMLVPVVSCDRTSHRRTAEDCAAQGLIYFLAPDVVSLLRGCRAQLDKKRRCCLWLRAGDQDLLHDCRYSSRPALVVQCRRCSMFGARGRRCHWHTD